MIRESVQITKNSQIALDIWRMEVHAPGISSFYKGAGQFIQIQLSDGWENSLSRPMSIAKCEEEYISIIYKIFGLGTSILSNKKTGEKINILGPLGNIFSINNNNSHILVGGGVGLAPVLNLWNHFTDQTNKNYLIIGARTGDEHIHQHNPEKHIYITTDDGSMGIKGTVMKALKEISKNIQKPVIIACGPEPMLKAIQSYVKINEIPTQLSVESYMGCGIGICQGCVILRQNTTKKDHSYHEQYSLVCLDGPVYKSEAISFG